MSGFPDYTGALQSSLPANPLANFGGNFVGGGGYGTPPIAPGTVSPTMVPGGGAAGMKLGMNMGTANLAINGLSTIGNLWAAFQTQKLAKEQFKFSKGMANTNLANQIKSYNTALEDKITSRAFTQGMSSSDAQAYIDKNKATDQRKKGG